MRLLFIVSLALLIGAGVGRFGPAFVFAAGKTELTFPAPDPDPKLVNPPKPGAAFACDPLADANVFAARSTHEATVWTNYEGSKAAIQISGDGKRLAFMLADDVSAGITQPQEFNITAQR